MRTGPRCANPLCGKTLPLHATHRRRYCDAACRVAAHRIARPSATAHDLPDAQEVVSLAEVTQARAAGLAGSAQVLADKAAGVVTGRAALLSEQAAALTELTDAATRAAVAHDRATGATWEQIGKTLGVHPDTARGRYSSTGL